MEIGLRLFSPGAAMSKRLGTNLADGALMLISGVLTMVLPYLAGKQLIEQGSGEPHAMRRKLVGRDSGVAGHCGGIERLRFL